ncbi:casein kinase ii subunit alpha [Anaeramoeba flamelloides]|uniref:non-specific serine/threonine protein kinase n=1 Tax=Anaeramoeba flamelloides TaxID=1746091 RepID=A0ABQ8YRW4_9EUKA|nr:casein kinase ii subunit alpha [Anaeramoeba flamelloides]
MNSLKVIIFLIFLNLVVSIEDQVDMSRPPKRRFLRIHPETVTQPENPFYLFKRSRCYKYQSKSRYYSDVNQNLPSTEWDYTKFKYQINNETQFTFHGSIGRGRYSDVYRGQHPETKKWVAIKVLKPNDKDKINREIQVLQKLKDGPSIIKLLDIIPNTKDLFSNEPSLVFELLGTENIRDLANDFTDVQLTLFTYRLLEALEYSHSHGIIHRDLKLKNIVMNAEDKEVRLIDWGLGEFYFPGREYNVKVGTRPYKGPELLAGIRDYNYSLDIWMLGCVFGELLFSVRNLFYGKNDRQQLRAIVKQLGTDELYKYLEKYHVEFSQHFRNLLGYHKKQDWKHLIKPNNKHRVNDEALDLLSKFLAYDHLKRISAKEALQHPYFDKVRNLS